MVMLPERSAALDSVRTIVSRDLDYSDRFEMITLPGGDSIRMSASPPHTGTATRGAGAANTLNYPLYQALGADFAIEIAASGDTVQATLHDVATSGVRRVLKARVPSGIRSFDDGPPLGGPDRRCRARDARQRRNADPLRDRRQAASHRPGRE
jgi:hypothetical protein